MNRSEYVAFEGLKEAARMGHKGHKVRHQAVRRQRGFTLPELMMTVIWLAAVVGWMLNIVKVYNDVSAMGPASDLTAMTILRIVGIIAAPLGAVLGYL